MLQRTPLFSEYAKHGAKIVNFNGWEMPVQFSGIINEHTAVREKAGLFDVSHMGEFEVTGPEAKEFLQYVVTNDVNKLEPGKAMYTLLTNERGGTVDDLLVYCLEENTRYLVVVNAGNIDKDFAWMKSHSSRFDVQLENKSSDISLIALQGPAAAAIIQSKISEDLSELRPFRFLQTTLFEVPCLLSRTGYTGEDGFEIYVAEGDAKNLWEQLMEHGKDEGLSPCGLGCRDTLRLEARLPLYGQELDEDITPLEAGLSPFVKLDKGEFIGRDALVQQKEQGVPRKLVGIQVQERGIPRHGYDVYSGDERIGVVTSGTMSPTLKTQIGLALIDKAYSELGTIVEVDIRGKRVSAEVIKTPFYKRS